VTCSRESVVGAGRLDLFAPEEAANERDRLGKPVDACRRAGFPVETVSRVLPLEPAAPEPEHEASAADVIERDCLLRDESRITQADRAHEQTDRCPLRRRSDGRERRPRLEARIAVI